MKTRKILSLLVALALLIGLVTVPVASAASGVIYDFQKDPEAVVGAEVGGDSNPWAFMQRAGSPTTIIEEYNDGVSLSVSNLAQDYFAIDLRIQEIITVPDEEYTFSIKGRLAENTGSARFEVVFAQSATYKMIGQDNNIGQDGSFAVEFTVKYTADEIASWPNVKPEYGGESYRLRPGTSKISFNIDSIIISGPGESLLPDPEPEPGEEEDEEDEEDDVDEGEASLDNFTKVNTYASGHFSDIDDDSAYHAWSILSYEYGIFAGNVGSFGVGDGILIQQAITIAAKLHMIYNTGEAEDLAYPDGFIAYAKENKIIGDEFEDVYEKAATRGEVTYIWASILPDELMEAVIKFDSVSDVASTHAYYSTIKLFYEAGIVSGTTATTFGPDEPILRGQAAVMSVRLIGIDRLEAGEDEEEEDEEEEEEEEEEEPEPVIVTEWELPLNGTTGYTHNDGGALPMWVTIGTEKSEVGIPVDVFVKSTGIVFEMPQPTRPLVFIYMGGGNGWSWTQKEGVETVCEWADGKFTILWETFDIDAATFHFKEDDNGVKLFFGSWGVRWEWQEVSKIYLIGEFEVPGK